MRRRGPTLTWPCVAVHRVLAAPEAILAAEERGGAGARPHLWGQWSKGQQGLDHPTTYVGMQLFLKMHLIHKLRYEKK